MSPEVALRQLLERRLRQPLPPSAWTFLINKGFVAEALDGDPFSVDECIQAARELIQVGAEMAGRARPPRNTRDSADPSLLTGLERARAVAISERMAILADRLQSTRNFRDQALGGATFARSSALEFLVSPVARYVSLDLLRQGGWTARSQVNVLGDVLDSTYRPDGRRVDFALPDGEPISAFVEASPPMYKVREENGQEHVVTASDWSALGKLREAADGLSDAVRWPPEEAAWFILTGRAPGVPAIVMRSSIGQSMRATGRVDTATVTMTIAPWVSPTTVARAYREVQRRVLSRVDERLAFRSRRGPAPPVRRNRALSERPLLVLGFVSQILHSEGPCGWRELTARWNRAHPLSQYSSHRNFARDYALAVEAVIVPDHRDKPRS